MHKSIYPFIVTNRRKDVTNINIHSPSELIEHINNNGSRAKKRSSSDSIVIDINVDLEHIIKNNLNNNRISTTQLDNVIYSYMGMYNDQKILSHLQLGYWINRGHSNEYATLRISDIQKCNSDKNSLESLISNYGNVIGLEKYKTTCRNKAFGSSLDGYIDRYGEVEGLKRYNIMRSNKAFGSSLDGYIDRHGDEKGLVIFKQRYSLLHNEFTTIPPFIFGYHSTDYKRNLIQYWRQMNPLYNIPNGFTVHHITPKTVAKDSGWTEEQINHPRNLIALHPDDHISIHRLRGDKINDNFIRVVGISNKGKKAYTDGEKTYYFDEGDAPINMIKGRFGVSRRKGKKCYNNGIQNVYFKDGDEVPLNFKLGHLKSRSKDTVIS
jgi:hypothetical protein